MIETAYDKLICDREEIQRACSALFADGDVVELRVLAAQTPNYRRPHVESGYFDDWSKLANAASGISSAKGFYITLNPTDPALLSRAANRIRPADRDPTTADHNIVKRRWLLLDFDAERPAGISSSNEEHKAAIEVTLAARDKLTAAGWPEPIFADSGNGGHLLYRIDLSADDGGLVERVLTDAAEQFGELDDRVGVDTTVFNPSRICKLYGTPACKGDSTPERPHRLARLFSVPKTLEVVPVELLEALATPAAKPAYNNRSYNGNGKGNGSGNGQFDIAEWITRHGLDVDGPLEWRGGRKWVFGTCPWNEEHRDRSAYVIQHPSGALSAGCHHDGCQGKGWQDLRDIYEPDRHRYRQEDPEVDRDDFMDNMTGSRQAGERRKCPLTDSGNAERLVDLYGDRVRYCHPWSKWLAWDGQKWAIDQAGAVEQLAKQTARSILKEAAGVENTDQRDSLIKWARRSESANGRAATLRLAQSEAGIPVMPEKLDKDRYKLNVENGTIDLKTGKLLPHDKRDMITKLAPVVFDPDAKAPTFERFLHDIFVGDGDLIGFMQRFLGYAATGDVGEQIIPVWYGVGSNGKSTLVNVQLDVLGPDYAFKAPADLLLTKRGQEHPTALTDLHGKRFAACVETDDGRRLAEAMVKELTGGDPIRARRMREDFWQFWPSHKVVLACNHKPAVRGTDHAIWRRIKLVPFKAIIPKEKRDRDLSSKLQAERAGILAWLVRGCLDWQQHGLGEPMAVVAATSDYSAEEDVLAQFIMECCVQGEDAKVRASDLVDAYKAWCGDKRMTVRQMTRKVEEMGITKYKSSGIWYRGIELQTTG